MDQLKFAFRQEAGSTTLDLYIYSEVCGDYYDLDEDWNLKKITSETSADYFRRQLAEHAGATQINLYINSMGGSVREGYGIYCQLKRHPAQKTAYIDGFACSIASIIACAGDRVIAYPNSMMMIHRMTDGVNGNADDLREAADALDKIMEGNRQVYLQKSGGKLTEAELLKMLAGETWLTAEDCLACGLVDEIRQQGGMSGRDGAALLEKANRDLMGQLARRRMLWQAARDADLQTRPAAAAPAGGTPQPVESPPASATPADGAAAEGLSPAQRAAEEKTLAALFTGFRKAQP